MASGQYHSVLRIEVSWLLVAKEESIFEVVVPHPAGAWQSEDAEARDVGWVGIIAVILSSTNA